MFTRVAELAFLDMRKKLVRDLRIDSEILERIHTEFVKMLYSGDFNIHSFQEGKPINAKIGKVCDISVILGFVDTKSLRSWKISRPGLTRTRCKLLRPLKQAIEKWRDSGALMTLDTSKSPEP